MMSNEEIKKPSSEARKRTLNNPVIEAQWKRYQAERKKTTNNTSKSPRTLGQAFPINMAEAFPGAISKPTLSQYGLEELDLKELEAAYSEYSNPKETKGERFWGRLFYGIEIFGVIAFFGGTIVGAISIFNSTFNKYFGKDGPYTSYLLVAILAGFVMPLIATTLDSVTSNRKKKAPFARQKEWDNYQKYLVHQKKYKDHLHTLNVNYWRNMGGYRFEDEVTKLFNDLGYSATRTKYSGDGGIDISMEKDGKRYAVQCKAHAKRRPPSEINELLGAMTAKGYDAGFFVATNGVSDKALELCRSLKEKPITVLDAEDLVEMSRALSSESEMEKKIYKPQSKTYLAAHNKRSPGYTELTDDDIPF